MSQNVTLARQAQRKSRVRMTKTRRIAANLEHNQWVLWPGRQRLLLRDTRTTNRRPRRTAAQQIPAQMCLRRARRVKKMARRSPSTAPIKASQIVLLSNDRAPLPAIRKLQYAIARVQRIMRRLLMGPHLSISKYCHTLSLRAEDF